MSQVNDHLDDVEFNVTEQFKALTTQVTRTRVDGREVEVEETAFAIRDAFDPVHMTAGPDNAVVTAEIEAR